MLRECPPRSTARSRVRPFLGLRLTGQHIRRAAQQRRRRTRSLCAVDAAALLSRDWAVRTRWLWHHEGRGPCRLRPTRRARRAESTRQWEP